MSAVIPLRHPATTGSLGSLVDEVICSQKKNSNLCHLLITEALSGHVNEAHGVYLAFQLSEVCSVEFFRVCYHLARMNFPQHSQELIYVTKN